MIAAATNPMNTAFVFGVCALWVGIMIVMARRDK